MCKGAAVVMDRLGTRNRIFGYPESADKCFFKSKVEQGFSSFSPQIFSIVDDFVEKSSYTLRKHLAKNEEKPCLKPISP